MGTEAFVQILITSVVTILSTSGFWAYIQHKDKTRKAMDRLVMGLAYEQIMSLAFRYIERGWITQDEYDDYKRYLYEPYKELGGNGITGRLHSEVESLPIRSRAKYAELVNAVKLRGAENDSPNGSFDQDEAA